MSNKEILKELLIDKDKMIKDSVQILKPILGIDPSGEVIFNIPLKNFSDKEKLSLYLLARYFSKELDLIKNETVSISDLEIKLGIERKNVSRRLSELKQDGLVQSESKGRYKIVSSRINEIIISIKKKGKKEIQI